MSYNVAQKLIKKHLVAGIMEPGSEIGLKIDQSLTQDASGQNAMLYLEAMNLDRIKTEVSAQYIDHNLTQEDNKNPDDHIFLHSASQRYGSYFSRAGGGVSHPVHMQRFGIPGKTLLGTDSHTCAAGSLGMLAMGAGAISVAIAMAGHPFYVKMPHIWGVRLSGKMPDWVSAKDIILEMLRRHSVKGAVGRIIEYYGPGLKGLSAMDRHVIANMGAELGATTTVFPSDGETQLFLKRQQREYDWIELKADENATYDFHEEIDLSKLEPLIALPSSPDNVVPVREVEGREIYQSYIGSSANPGYRDFSIPAMVIEGEKVFDNVSLDINPTSRQMLADLAKEGHIGSFIQAGARLHQAGCNGCIGMGQAPATGKNSLRTTPRNFPGRSGTKEDAVFLCSPETAIASAIYGKITDPRNLTMKYPKFTPVENPTIDTNLLEVPLPIEEAKKVKLEKGPNIVSIPEMKSLRDQFENETLLKLGDNISTDEIHAGGSKVLPFRSNIPESSKFAFEIVDDTYYSRAMTQKEKGHVIIAGFNYGQGSSREHAALTPRYLGLNIVIAKSFARIHWENLVNVGVLPLTFVNSDDYDKIEKGDILSFTNLREAIMEESTIQLNIKNKNINIEGKHDLSPRQIKVLLKGGLLNWAKEQQLD